ncbi:DegT/DnrJ/EryC1/StrS family aminotransferase [Candidatus Pelagibacter sp.]|nr:DegT/DnrJ/EryC1/StrS family aminotransferase [Candidatus Pelagibacter sp.]|tara:strand:- start:1082 stop:2194 length:1113 start_codon:yes stop_codon:yes gene_type:complete
MNVSFLDLKVKDKKFRKKILNKINKILLSGKILNGIEQKIFEKKISKFLKAKYAVGVSSGSSALYLALKANDIGRGDEVITTPFTWIITSHAIASLGAKPVFVDIDENFNLDPSQIKKAINKKTKAIVPMHVAGKLCSMENIYKIAKKYNLKIIEDAAQSICSSYKGKKSGYYSDACAFSFNPMKVLNSYGEAGIVTTNSKKIYNKLICLRHAGTIRYKNSFNINNSNDISLNHKIDTIHASILIEKLKYLKDVLNRREKISQYYIKHLNNMMLTQTLEPKEIHGRYLFLARFKKRNKLRSFLNAKGVETKVFYSPLVSEAKIYKNCKKYNLKNSNKILKEVIALPFHENLSFIEIKYVIRQIKKFYEKN